MKIHCSLEANDYVRAQYLHMRPRPLFKWLGIFIALMAVTSSMLSIIYSSTPHFSTFAVVAAAFIYAFMFAFWLPFKTRKIFKQQKMLHEPYESDIDETGIFTSSSHGSAKLSWKDFHKYKVGKTSVLVYQSDSLYHMFPKRWFSDEEFDIFLSYLHQSLGKPK